MSTFSVLLPVLDPIQNKDYFSPLQEEAIWFIPQAIAYRISSLLHTDLLAVYRHELTAPS